MPPTGLAGMGHDRAPICRQLLCPDPRRRPALACAYRRCRGRHLHRRRRPGRPQPGAGTGRARPPRRAAGSPARRLGRVWPQRRLRRRRLFAGRQAPDRARRAGRCPPALRPDAGGGADDPPAHCPFRDRMRPGRARHPEGGSGRGGPGLERDIDFMAERFGVTTLEHWSAERLRGVGDGPLQRRRPAEGLGPSPLAELCPRHRRRRCRRGRDPRGLARHRPQPGRRGEGGTDGGRPGAGARGGVRLRRLCRHAARACRWRPCRSRPTSC